MISLPKFLSSFLLEFMLIATTAKNLLGNFKIVNPFLHGSYITPIMTQHYLLNQSQTVKTHRFFFLSFQLHCNEDLQAPFFYITSLG